MKNLSTGTGLALLAGAVLAYPFVSSLAPNANASAVTAAATVTTAATGQAAPTIVWYGIQPALRPGGNGGTSTQGAIFRTWSDGRIEYKTYSPAGDGCAFPNIADCPGWRLFSDPAQGLTYRSDINFDQKVDGADLATLLNDWGSAPRQDIPPSDCPLALINP